jgi:DNA polymerase
MPFIEIKGIGESQADKCMSLARPGISSRKGFFVRMESQQEGKGKLQNLLQEVKAFDPNPLAGPDNPKEYFQFSFAEAKGEKAVIEIVRKQMVINPLAKRCEACKLRAQAGQVVLSSTGMFNVLVLGEAPGKEEDKRGMGYVGPVSQTLWDELSLYGITRRMLHVGNVVKCWPSKDKTPSKADILECFDRCWGKKEILSMECRLILATGNSPLYALTGRDSGISALSGQVEWVEKVKAHVVWCVHPSAVVRNAQANTDAFCKGIEMFAKLFHENRRRG